MKRPIRIANCSGAVTDPGVHMYNQAKYGQVDVITGDYLAEANMAGSKVSGRPGWVVTALDGITQTLDLINEKRIKVVINGGGLDPKGLAEEVNNLVETKNFDLKVAYVHGDDLMHKVHNLLKDSPSGHLPHLDHANPQVKLEKNTLSFLQDPENMPIVSANAYLGYRAIKLGLDSGADIIICGRVADASPVIAAAAWWHGWSETDYDELAAGLIGGHLIECSTYVTGANFAGAYKYPVKEFLHLGLPITEISKNGVIVLTKHERLGGFVTADTVKCQLLYELQGNIYLNSDVKADIKNISVRQESKDRVRVVGVKGHPPPATTKLAIFYRSGYQNEILINASGYATTHKWDIQEAQIKEKLREWGVLDDLDILEFQRVGVPMENPDSQLASTTYMRIFTQAKKEDTIRMVAAAWNFTFMAHFAGMHCSLDLRTIIPKPVLGYYPCVVSQSEIEESLSFLQSHRGSTVVGPPKATEPIQPREDYDTQIPMALETFGPAKMRPLGDIALGRSGDKGANVNLGLFVQTPEQWEWLRSFMSKERLRQLMGRDWRESYFIERVEMANIYAVHFVVYGPLGRGVSSSKLLDSLGKGFAEFIRAVHIPIPIRFFQESSKL